MPVPAGPMPKVRSCERIAWRYCCWLAPRPRISPRSVSTASRVVRRARAHAALLDREVHVLGRHRLAARALVELAQHGRPGRGVRAAQREAPGAAADLDAEPVLDLVQVLVERPADRGEPRIVFRAEVDAGFGGGVQATNRPRREFGMASVMRTSAKRSTSDRGPSKFTQRMFSVRPASWRGSRREGFSTSTRCGAADHRLADAPCLAVELRLQRLEPLLLDLVRHLVRQRGRRRAGPLAVDEAEGLVEADVRDQLERLLEVRLGLAGEADDEVGRQADVRAHRAQRGGSSACTRGACSRAS